MTSSPATRGEHLDSRRRTVDGARDRAAAGELAARPQDLSRQQRRQLAGFSHAAAGDARTCASFSTGAGSSAFIGECLAPLLLRTAQPPRGSDRDDRSAVRSATSIFSKTCRRCSCPLAAPAAVRRASRRSLWRRRCCASVISWSSPATNRATFTSSPAAGETAWRSCCRPKRTIGGFAMTSSFTSMMLAARLAFCGAGEESRDVALIARGRRRSRLHRHNAPLRDAGGAETILAGRVSGQQRLQGTGARSGTEIAGADRRPGRRRIRFAARLPPWTEDHRDAGYAAGRVRLQRPATRAATISTYCASCARTAWRRIRPSPLAVDDVVAQGDVPVHVPELAQAEEAATLYSSVHRVRPAVRIPLARSPSAARRTCRATPAR